MARLIDTDDPAFYYIVRACLEMQHAGVKLDKAAVEIAVCLGRRRYRFQEEVRQRPAKPYEGAPCVPPDVADAVIYYIRRGSFIKIGTTTNLWNRLFSLLPDEVLAVEPGSYSTEAERHARFDHLRVWEMGEYFRMGEDLLEHVGHVRRQHGPPDPALPVYRDTPRSSRAASVGGGGGRGVVS